MLFPKFIKFAVKSSITSNGINVWYKLPPSVESVEEMINDFKKIYKIDLELSLYTSDEYLIDLSMKTQNDEVFCQGQQFIVCPSIPKELATKRDEDFDNGVLTNLNDFTGDMGTNNGFDHTGNDGNKLCVANEIEVMTTRTTAELEHTNGVGQNGHRVARKRKISMVTINEAPHCSKKIKVQRRMTAQEREESSARFRFRTLKRKPVTTLSPPQSKKIKMDRKTDFQLSSKLFPGRCITEAHIGSFMLIWSKGQIKPKIVEVLDVGPKSIRAQIVESHSGIDDDGMEVYYEKHGIYNAQIVIPVDKENAKADEVKDDLDFD